MGRGRPIPRIAGLVALVIAVATAAWAQETLKEEISFAREKQVPYQLPATVEMGPEIVVADADVRQHQPASAYNSLRDEYLVVWHSDTAPHTVHARRLAGDGTLLNTFQVSSPLSNSCISPDVAHDPWRDRYLVVWLHDYSGAGDDHDVVGRFVGATGPDPSLTDFDIDFSSRNSGIRRWSSTRPGTSSWSSTPARPRAFRSTCRPAGWRPTARASAWA